MLNLRNALSVTVVSVAMAGGVAQADMVRDLSPGIAVMGGVIDPELSGASSDWGYGVEASADCLLLQPAQGVLRHQLSITRYDDRPLRMTSTELNTHWMFEVAPRLEIGAGPGISYMRARLGGETNGLWGAQVGGSMNYTLDNNVFMGVEARYQFTESERFNGSSEDMDNYRVMGKVGIRM